MAVPGARSRAAFAYDSDRNRIVFFGGYDGAGGTGDTWEYDVRAKVWLRINPTVSPTNRWAAFAGYDQNRKKVVMAGGYNGSTVLGDVWEYTPGPTPTWTAAPSLPAARFVGTFGNYLAYDPVRKTLFLFGGGNSAFAVTQNIWEYNGTTWTDRNPASPPTARNGNAWVYDPARSKFFMCGGTDGTNLLAPTTWEYDSAANTWTQRAPASNPPGFSAMSCFALNGKVYLVNGTTGAAGTAGSVTPATQWVWDGVAGTWTDQTATVTKPSARHSAGCIAASNNRAYSYGGDPGVGSQMNDMWEFDGNLTWTTVAPFVGPQGRYSHAMAYDTMRNKIVLFGGYNGGGLGDTWEFDVLTGVWTAMSPTAGGPGARWASFIGYDANRNKIVLYGGWSGGLQLNDTYEYTPNGTQPTWTQKNPAAQPAGRATSDQGWSIRLVYDPVRLTLVLFGGRSNAGNLNDLWEYDGTNWTNRNPTGTPPPVTQSNAYTFIYDPSVSKFLLFGGQDFNQQAGPADTYEYDSAANAWTKRAPVASPGQFQYGTPWVQNSRVKFMGGLNGAGAGSIAPIQQWEWSSSGNTWTQNVTAALPTLRSRGATVQKSAADRPLNFGGANGLSTYYLDEMWEYDGTNWYPVSSYFPPNSPTGGGGGGTSIFSHVFGSGFSEYFGAGFH
jgi:hypothetical protein